MSHSAYETGVSAPSLALLMIPTNQVNYLELLELHRLFQQCTFRQFIGGAPFYGFEAQYVPVGNS